MRGKDVPRPVRSWNQCGLSGRILEILRKAGMTDPMPIQAQARLRCHHPWPICDAESPGRGCVLKHTCVAASQVRFDVRQQRSQSRVRLPCFIVALHQVCMQPHANAFLALRRNVKDL